MIQDHIDEMRSEMSSEMSEHHELGECNPHSINLSIASSSAAGEYHGSSSPKSYSPGKYIDLYKQMKAAHSSQATLFAF